jgi:hypothetical protein
VIITQDFGYTLRCTGCRAYITLSMRELRDLDRTLDIKSAMRKVHEDCDGFGDVKVAARAMKTRIRAERRVATGGRACDIAEAR